MNVSTVWCKPEQMTSQIQRIREEDHNRMVFGTVDPYTYTYTGIFGEQSNQ